MNVLLLKIGNSGKNESTMINDLFKYMCSVHEVK